MHEPKSDHSWWALAGWLLAVTAAAWLISAWPAWLLAGSVGLEGLAWAAGLCLAAGWLVIALLSLLEERQRPVFGMLLGTGLRLVVVLVGAVIVSVARPELGLREFFVWLGPFYVVTLVFETRWLLSGLPATGSRTPLNPSDEVGVKLG